MQFCEEYLFIYSKCIYDYLERDIFNQASPGLIASPSTTDSFGYIRISAEGNDGESLLPSSQTQPSCIQFIENYIAMHGRGITSYVMGNNKLT